MRVITEAVVAGGRGDQAVRGGDLPALALGVGGEMAPEPGDFDANGQEARAELALYCLKPCQERTLAAAFGQQLRTFEYLADGDHADVGVFP